LGLPEFNEFREEDPDMERMVLFKKGKFAYAAIYADGESGEEFGTTQRSIPSDQKTYWKIPSFTHVSAQIPDSRFPDYYEITRLVPSQVPDYYEIPSLDPDSRFPDYYEIIHLHSPLSTLHSPLATRHSPPPS
jgi:hypothetical protein